MVISLDALAPIIVGLIGAIASVIVTSITAKMTRDKFTQELNTSQQLLKQDISYMKSDISSMKDDIKAHNHYAQLFNENIPLIKEKILVSNHRLKDLEDDVRFYHRNRPTED